MTHNSKRAWKTIKKLNSENKTATRVAAVTPNEVASQLLRNGKPSNKERGHTKNMKREMTRTMQESEDHVDLFTMEELEKALSSLKLGKTAGLDGITTEVLQHFGPRAKTWILALFNQCATHTTIPKAWRKARVVALLKPGKDPNHKKSYRPISLLSIPYKLYERMIMSRMSPTVEQQLSPDQAGFRPGRSCCDQLLNLTQYIEDGFETKQITGAVFVDLTAAYDTVNHRILLLKIAKVIKNKRIVRIIESLLKKQTVFCGNGWKKKQVSHPEKWTPTRFCISSNTLQHLHKRPACF